MGLLARKALRLMGRSSRLATDSPVGRYGRVTPSGRIDRGKLGEVRVEMRGGVEHYYALDADDGMIHPGEEVVIIDQPSPRTVLVTRVGDLDQRR